MQIWAEEHSSRRSNEQDGKLEFWVGSLVLGDERAFTYIVHFTVDIMGAPG